MEYLEGGRCELIGDVRAGEEGIILLVGWYRRFVWCVVRLDNGEWLEVNGDNVLPLDGGEIRCH